MEKDRIDKIIGIIRSLKEDVGAMPTNNISGGNIAGAPPDHPPVRNKKKRYIYAKNTRKNWSVG